MPLIPALQALESPSARAVPAKAWTAPESLPSRFLGRVRQAWLPTFLALSFLAPAAHATTTFCGTVTSVVDGDTEWVHTTTGQNVKIRLHIADAPEVAHNSKEVDQPYGREATQVLYDLTFGKTVCAVVKGYSYARPVVDLTVGAIHVNHEMISIGAAWAWAPSGHFPPKFESALQAEAQANRLGLWALPNPIPPWIWRKEHNIKYDRSSSPQD